MASKTHKTLWNHVERMLREAGVEATAEQCVNKFKDLKRVWRSCIDHNAKTGNEPKTCPFFNELNEVYGMKPSTRPSFTFSSYSKQKGQMNVWKASEKSHLEDEVAENDDHGLENTVKQSPKKARKKHSRLRRENHSSVSLEWLQEYEERHSRAREKMHKEKCALMERFITAFENKN